MGRNKIFQAALIAFLLVTAFVAGYEAKSLPEAAPAVAAMEPRSQVSFLHALTRARDDQLTQENGDVDPVEIFWEVLHHLKDKYVDEITDDRALAYGAIRGMLRTLGDPYTRFMDPKDYRDFQEENQGEFEGIGAMLGIDRETEKITIIQVFEDNPAARAGLKPGDRILAINGESALDMSLDAAVSKIRGPAGTQVTLRIERPRPPAEKEKTSPSTQPSPRLPPVREEMPEIEGEVLDIVITRGRVKIPIVEWRMLEGEIGYAWLKVFNEKSDEQLNAALRDLQEKDMKGFILDLRYNPGGLLDMAVDIASMFVQSGPIVHIKERGHARETLYARPGEYKDLQVPLVVLVNRYSASASEIVAGAVQDTGVGTVVGEPTFGKGLVQTVVALSDNSAVAITTAKYLTPKERDINENGIKPDLVVHQPEPGEGEGEAEKPLEDLQLQRAIKVIQERLQASPL
ncbi:MAG TPA: S41 family peptidase [Armatimonadetes bacterium]|nr:S41 family peptidase [Armatimonadota bacterium]